MQAIPSRWLASSAGDYQLTEHPAVHSIDEARIHVPAMPGLVVKNLFVRDEKGWRHLLVIVPCDKRVELALRQSARMESEPGHPPGCMVALGCMSAPTDEHAAVAAPLTASRARTRAGFVHCVERGVASRVTA